MLYHWATQESSHTKTPFRTKFLRGTVCRLALRKPVLYVGYKVWFILEKRAVRNLAEVSGSLLKLLGAEHKEFKKLSETFDPSCGQTILSFHKCLLGFRKSKFWKNCWGINHHIWPLKSLSLLSSIGQWLKRVAESPQQNRHVASIRVKCHGSRTQRSCRKKWLSVRENETLFCVFNVALLLCLNI